MRFGSSERPAPSMAAPDENGERSALRDLAVGASVEVPPHAVGESLARHLPRGASVYVPFLPRGRWRDTVAACERILSARMKPVPHLLARGLRSAAELDARLSELDGAGVDSLLLVAGDRAEAAGPYPDAPAVLDSGLLAEHGFRSLGVAAHPEGHPFVDRGRLDSALSRKMEYAAATGTRMWVVTQFGFSPAPFLNWLARIEDAGCTLPVRIGVPGPARLHTLTIYAARCGIGPSARFLRRRPGAMRLAGRWSPDVVAAPLARHLAANPGTTLAGIHLFTFGGLKASADWLRAAREENGREPPDAAGRYGELLAFRRDAAGDSGAPSG